MITSKVLQFELQPTKMLPGTHRNGFNNNKMSTQLHHIPSEDMLDRQQFEDSLGQGVVGIRSLDDIQNNAAMDHQLISRLLHETENTTTTHTLLKILC